jgi:hypothetical protein
MASVNKVIIVGNLGADPETRYLPSGDAVTSIRVATTDRYKDKQSGEMKEATEWHSISFFAKLAEIAGQYLRKGSQVYVEGSLRTRKYTDKNGVEKYARHGRSVRRRWQCWRWWRLCASPGPCAPSGCARTAPSLCSQASGQQFRRHGRRHPVLTSGRCAWREFVLKPVAYPTGFLTTQFPHVRTRHRPWPATSRVP